MNASDQTQEQTDKVSDADISSGVTFLRTLSDESDTTLFRPIETWTEAGKKNSRVDNRNTSYCKAEPGLLKGTVTRLVTLVAEERLNLFFGVCPRFDGGGRFDLAWQIRTVRSLWSDIDHVTVQEAREQMAKARIPEPSIIVNSGYGMHIYWLLESPYIIDDAGDPPPVETEWTPTPDGRRTPRKYVIEHGDRVYLDQRRHVSRLSAKAQHIQDVLVGIAQAVGGDHTTDLARLLRLPGTLNRKDERNGREPAPTSLVECHFDRKYPLTTFESLKAASPETVRNRQILSMPLPKPRKLRHSKADKLDKLIAASGIAPPGSRSEPDFAMCCFAIRNGVGKEEVWTQVEQVGKFAEQGRRYFDLTWESAEYDERAATFDKLQKGSAPKGPPIAVSATYANGDCGDDLPPADKVAETGGRPTILVDAESMMVSETLHHVAAECPPHGARNSGMKTQRRPGNSGIRP